MGRSFASRCLTNSILYPKNMKYLIYTLVFIFAGSFAQSEEDVLLRCKFYTGWEKYYLIEHSKQTITLIGTDEGVVCNLTTKPHLYEWQCAGTAKVPAQVGKVNRYTGEYETEWGQKPFGSFRDGNNRAFGNCSKEKAEKLF